MLIYIVNYYKWIVYCKNVIDVNLFKIEYIKNISLQNISLQNWIYKKSQILKFYYCTNVKFINCLQINLKDKFL